MLSELGGAMGAFLEDVIASLPQDGHKAAQWKVQIKLGLDPDLGI